SLRRGLGPNDVAIVLSETPASNTGYPPAAPSISIGPGDRCDACSVAGDGPDANPGHARFQTTFEAAGRGFELTVEFGSDQVTQAQLDQVNAALAPLAIG